MSFQKRTQLYAYKSTDQTAIGTSYADVIGTGIPIIAYGAYAFEFFLVCDADAVTTGIDIAVNGPSSPTSVNYNVLMWTTTTGTVWRGAVAYDTDTAQTASAGTAQRVYYVTGTVRNGANAGTLIARAKREAVGSGPNVRAGSYGRAWKLN